MYVFIHIICAACICRYIYRHEYISKHIDMRASCQHVDQIYLIYHYTYTDIYRMYKHIYTYTCVCIIIYMHDYICIVYVYIYTYKCMFIYVRTRSRVLPAHGPNLSDIYICLDHTYMYMSCWTTKSVLLCFAVSPRGTTRITIMYEYGTHTLSLHYFVTLTVCL